MQFSRDVHHRRSIRLHGFDYSQPGAYFITICTRGREPLFGAVVDGVMVMNDAGMMVEKYWCELPNKFSGIYVGEYVVMPNHFHGIVHIVGALLAAPPISAPPISASCIQDAGLDRGAASSAPTLGTIMRRFKSMSAIAVNRSMNREGQPLWQRNYYEHIIRHEQAYEAIADYIHHNPQRWQDDVYCCQ